MVIFAALKSQALRTVNDQVKDLYGGQVRVRVCGICIVKDKILLVNHSLYGKGTSFWIPPGGGIKFGETADSALVREFKEEAGLDVIAGDLLFINEHIKPPLHAIELFFEIKSFDGNPVKGADPEFSVENQIIADVRFMTLQDIKEMAADSVHSLFSKIDSLADIFLLNKYISQSNRKVNN
jgi:8-oxo-dGTP diphosphatase